MALMTGDTARCERADFAPERLDPGELFQASRASSSAAAPSKSAKESTGEARPERPDTALDVFEALDVPDTWEVLPLSCFFQTKIIIIRQQQTSMQITQGDFYIVKKKS
jgi:hypothetical protein